MPKISVIVPVYKTEKFLDNCVNSILNQSFEDFEVILIDDCSPDNSGVKCDSYTDKRVRTIHLEKNGGLSNARNVGIDNAKGEYILFIDSDDTIEKDTLKNTLDCAISSGCDMVLFGYNVVVEDENSSETVSKVCVDSCELKNKTEIAEKVIELKKKILIDSTCNKLYRKQLIKDSAVRMPVGELYEDTDFNIKLLNFVNSVSIMSDCYYNYIQRSQGSITKSYNANKIIYLKKRCLSLNDYFKNMNMFDGEIKKACNFFYIKYVFSCFIDLNFPSSKFSASEKIKFIKQEINDPDFMAALSDCSAVGKANTIVLKFAKTRNAKLIYFITKCAFYAKFKMQKQFLKIKDK